MYYYETPVLLKKKYKDKFKHRHLGNVYCRFLPASAL